MNNQITDIEVVKETPQTQALAIRPSQEIAPSGLFGTTEPVAIIEKATSVATALKNVIRSQGLISNISGKEYPKCEAWTLLGTMLGVFPVAVWTRKLEDGWEARVEARTQSGAVVGAAEAQCLRSERNWANRDDFALRSMAQTRATAKCLRMPLGFVMTLAGYQPTPAEEMVEDRPPTKAPYRPPQQKTSPAPPVNQAAPPKREVKEAIFADDSTRERMIAGLKDCHALATEYFEKLRNPTVLLPNEELKDVPLRYVPVTKHQMKLLLAKIADFGNGEEAAHAFYPNPEPPPKGQKAPPPSAKSGEVKEAPSIAAAKAKDPEWFWKAIISVPRKGMKKAEYDGNPDTIGSLYEAMKSGDEIAQARLWGLAHHWKPEPRQVGDKTYNPSAADFATRAALDAFEAFEKAKPQSEPSEPEPDEQTPF